MYNLMVLKSGKVLFGLFISIYVMGGLPVILMFMHMDIIMME